MADPRPKSPPVPLSWSHFPTQLQHRTPSTQLWGSYDRPSLDIVMTTLPSGQRPLVAAPTVAAQSARTINPSNYRPTPPPPFVVPYPQPQAEKQQNHPPSRSESPTIPACLALPSRTSSLRATSRVSSQTSLRHATRWLPIPLENILTESTATTPRLTRDITGSSFHSESSFSSSDSDHLVTPLHIQHRETGSGCTDSNSKSMVKDISAFPLAVAENGAPDNHPSDIPWNTRANAKDRDGMLHATQGEPTPLRRSRSAYTRVSSTVVSPLRGHGRGIASPVSEEYSSFPSPPVPPPRPRRSSARLQSSPRFHPSVTTNPLVHLNCDRSSHLLGLPQTAYARSNSPSGDSIVTITASTPSPTTPRPYGLLPTSMHLFSSPEQLSSNIISRKRDSNQRRLEALRGLVNDLNLEQPWSIINECNDGPEIGLEDADVLDSMEPVPELMSDQSGSGSGSSRCFKQYRLDSSTWELNTTRASLESDTAATPTLTAPTGLRTGLVCKPIKHLPQWRKLPKARRDGVLGIKPRHLVQQRTETFAVASSGHSKSLASTSSQGSAQRPTAILATAWKDHLSDKNAYERLVSSAPDGQLEVRRQEIMWEMCETEDGFVRSVRTILRLFATPIRTAQGEWLSGIPESVTELFEALENIEYAHNNVAVAEKEAREGDGGILNVVGFVALFHAWVTELTCHEQYLICFEGAIKIVNECVRDQTSGFGEFLRMQMRDEALGCMNLGSMLLKPVQRLTKYPLFIKRLLEATRYPHPAHHDLVLLLKKTELIVLELQAAKSREDDYQQLHALQDSIYGLPDSFSLIARGRRLIGFGQVIRVPLPHKETGSSSATSAPSRKAGPYSSLREQWAQFKSMTGSVGLRPTPSLRGSLSSFSNASSWDYIPPSSRTSAFSVESTSSSCRSVSVASTSSVASVSPSRKSNSLSPVSPLRIVSRMPSTASSYTKYHLRSSTPSNSLHSSSSSFSTARTTCSRAPLTMFVFDDLVLLAAPERTKLFSKKRHDSCMLHAIAELDGGIGSVDMVRDVSGWSVPDHTNLFLLTLNSPNGLTTTTAYAPVSVSVSASKSISPLPQMRNSQVLGSMDQILRALAEATAIASCDFEKDFINDK